MRSADRAPSVGRRRGAAARRRGVAGARAAAAAGRGRPGRWRRRAGRRRQRRGASAIGSRDAGCGRVVSAWASQPGRRTTLPPRRAPSRAGRCGRGGAALRPPRVAGVAAAAMRAAVAGWTVPAWPRPAPSPLPPSPPRDRRDRRARAVATRRAPPRPAPSPITMRPSTIGSGRSCAGGSKPGTISFGISCLISRSMSRRKTVLVDADQRDRLARARRRGRCGRCGARSPRARSAARS